MHYKRLLEAHGKFYTYERRAYNYDNYMGHKDRSSWTNLVPIDEVRKLFDFIRSWDYHFKGEEDRFERIYREIHPYINKLGGQRIEDADLTDEELKRNISNVFDRVANCTSVDRYESTDASKILHIIVPNFFVMWDNNIRLGILGGGESKRGKEYAYDFLPLAQKELAEAIGTCTKERNLDREDAIMYIRQQCNHNTLAKLADEHNYVIHTLKLMIDEEETKSREEYGSFVERLNTLRKEGKITPEQRRALDDQWREEPHMRIWLLQQLKSL